MTGQPLNIICATLQMQRNPAPDTARGPVPHCAAAQLQSCRSPADHSLQGERQAKTLVFPVEDASWLAYREALETMQEAKMEAIVRAVDVGRGNTKFIAADNAGEMRCAMFPSQAYPCESAVEQETWGSRRKTVGIPVGNLIYEVGPDAHLASDIFNANMLQHDCYSDTPEYLALLLGALYYMRLDRIDLLVLGLPVATYKLKK